MGGYLYLHFRSSCSIKHSLHNMRLCTIYFHKLLPNTFKGTVNRAIVGLHSKIYNESKIYRFFNLRFWKHRVWIRYTHHVGYTKASAYNLWPMFTGDKVKQNISLLQESTMLAAKRRLKDQITIASCWLNKVSIYPRIQNFSAFGNVRKLSYQVT